MTPLVSADPDSVESDSVDPALGSPMVSGACALFLLSFDARPGKILAAALLLVLCGAIVYSLLAIVAALRYLAVRPPSLQTTEPISILKPLAGLDLDLESNLRTFFAQDYPAFEILFAVKTADDPAAEVVARLQWEYPHIPSRLIVTGEPPYPNAKVYSLDQMLPAAAHDLVVMSDSDIRSTADMLRVIAAEFQDPKLGVATCPYRAVPGPSFWSRLEATGMNTDFWSGALVARMLEGMRFAVGPTIAARRRVLHSIGGFERVKDYLAEDFVIGKFAAEAGHGVILSSYVIEHHIGDATLPQNLTHRLRWGRSTRRSRPAGYLGQLFTMPLPLALLVCAAAPAWWPVLALTLVVRALSAYTVSARVLRARINWLLLPIEDLMGFCFWIAGFFGNTISWRGRRYRLFSDGRFELIPPSE
ncbi:MAG TPA: bacteriohopanetetrol glucosamine biosynthesis glycosyltransferase HpnI [Candidatus Sulfotelmatobacter sp.]|nr:bacteriohopanetetrol glucosamine biosynthesis glycosyltransferase HpnI [Candidatus Sulfotelmatobacter sp.]